MSGGRTIKGEICRLIESGSDIVFILDHPFVSDILKKTVFDNQIPVVGTQAAQELGLLKGTAILSEEQAVELARENRDLTVYSNSENAIGWISENLSFGPLPGMIEHFKDKLKFRDLTRSLFPGFRYRAVRFEELEKTAIDELPLPFIIKPTVGFFSMGVHKVSRREEWIDTIAAIQEEIERERDIYPEEVFDAGMFIIEECIEGEEFAVDAYFDADGKPVVLSILKHVFSSGDDVSDRVYTSSKSIIEGNLAEFTEFIGGIGSLADIRRFPVHVELRRTPGGQLLPIEVNPMRFGGWCTTADLSLVAFGFNPYLLYINQETPDWEQILEGKEGKLFSIVVLDNSTGIDEHRIKSFDYQKLLSRFEKPLKMRDIDYHRYPVFGFLFTETREENYAELKAILDSDLTEFVSVA